MTGIELWSTTAANNNSASPNGWPEGMPPSGVNDTGRQMMAAMREWYESAEWINLGHTPTYIGASSFSVTGDKTSTYQIGRRIKAYGTTPFTIYGTISNSTYASVTTVTVTWDSGSLNATLSTVWISINSATNQSISTAAIKGYVSVPFTAASSSGPAAMEFAEDTDNGSNKVTLKAPNSISSNADVVLPASGTLATLDGTETLTNKTISTGSSIIAAALPNFVGDSGAGGTKGAVPAPASGDAAANKFLKANGTWSTVSSSITSITNSLGADVSLNNAALYFDGPRVAQGTSGTWFVSGTVTVLINSGADLIRVKLWDGTTVIASSYSGGGSTPGTATFSLSGAISSPAGNLRISVKSSSTTNIMRFNVSGESKDSTITAIRIA